MGKSIAPLDQAFLLTESADSPKHVGVLLRFDPPSKGASDRVQQVVAAYRAAKPTMPFDQLPEFPPLGLPRWKKAGADDPDHHVQHLLLPPGSSDDTLLKLVEDLTEPVPDRNRPLFRM